MTTKKLSPLYHWEQEMIDAYYDYQWHQVLDPLYEKFQQWQAGNFSHDEMDGAIHTTHRSCGMFTTFLRPSATFWFVSSNSMRTGFHNGSRIIQSQKHRKTKRD